MDIKSSNQFCRMLSDCFVNIMGSRSDRLPESLCPVNLTYVAGNKNTNAAKIIPDTFPTLKQIEATVNEALVKQMFKKTISVEVQAYLYQQRKLADASIAHGWALPSLSYPWSTPTIFTPLPYLLFFNLIILIFNLLLFMRFVQDEQVAMSLCFFCHLILLTSVLL